MHTLTIFGTEHYIAADRDEANRTWKEQPLARGRIWLAEEMRRLMLAGPEEVAAQVEKKRTVPGYVYKG